MSGIKISELPEATSVTGSSFIAVDNGNITRKISVDNYNSTANTTAQAYALRAEAASTAASESASSAAQRLVDVDSRVSSVTAIANNVSTTADAVAANATAANNAAAAASTAATDAETAAQEAANSAQDVDSAALLAESWARGGTGIRDGEDTNNAAYYARQAGAAIAGGVTSFNGRGGNVEPEHGDYTADKIVRGNSTVDADLTALANQASAAQSAANTAATNAAAAQSTANTAATNAAAAQTAADTAQTTANNALNAAGHLQNEIDALSTKVDAVDGINSVVLKTLTVAGWQLNGSVYEQTISFTKIHSLKPIITACGATLGTLATDEQYAALGGLKVTGDTDTNTMTFYAVTAPTVAINLSIGGCE